MGAAETNTGLYSFSAPTFAVYVVLGEDDGQPNLVLTVRGSTGRHRQRQSQRAADRDPGADLDRHADAVPLTHGHRERPAGRGRPAGPVALGHRHADG